MRPVDAGDLEVLSDEVDAELRIGHERVSSRANGARSAGDAPRRPLRHPRELLGGEQRRAEDLFEGHALGVHGLPEGRTRSAYGDAGPAPRGPEHPEVERAVAQP